MEQQEPHALHTTSTYKHGQHNNWSADKTGKFTRV